MNLHIASENKLFSNFSHRLFTQEYENEIEKLFANLQVLETSYKKYQSIPLSRKPERLKQSMTLFRIYWQNALKLLLPYARNEEITPQRLFMRYGLLHREDITPEDLENLGLIPLHIEKPSFIFYLDEWFHSIFEGEVPILNRDGAQIKIEKKTKDDGAANSHLIHEATSLEEVMVRLCTLSKSIGTPFLHRNDLSHPITKQVASREAVQKIIDITQNIDPRIFTRKLLKETIELEPYVFLVPSYADFGTCWEAFDRMERTNSRGRIVVPLYAPNTQRAVLVALANYRWETAKLAAGGYWLEKGLTGGFYDLYRKYSLPGRNEQQAFVAAYCLWILDESRGQIRFRPELRRFFWREIPFEESRSQLLVKYFGQFRDLSN